MTDPKQIVVDFEVPEYTASHTQSINASIEPPFGEAPPPYSVNPINAPVTNVSEQPGAPTHDQEVKFDPAKMTRSKTQNLHKDVVKIDALNLADQWIETGNNHKGEYTVGSLLMRNCRLEASNLHKPQFKIGSLLMECISIEVRNVHKATLEIDTLNIENGNIEFGNMHGASIRIGNLQLGNVTIKGKNVHDSELRIDNLVHNHKSSAVQLRNISNVKINLRSIDFSAGMDAVAFIEQIMMRGTYT